MIKALLNHLLPFDCVLCGHSSNNHSNLCETCLDDLPLINTPCHYCGIECLSPSSNHICGQCLIRKPVFNRCVGVLPYTNPVDQLVSQFKFQQNFAAGLALGELLAKKFESYCLEHGYPDAIVPIPLHYLRLKERGYNQALELAKPLRQSTHIPLLPKLLTRTKNTLPQTEIKRAGLRKSNLKNAFSCSDPALVKTYKHIALIDDVVTTGATLNEASRALFFAGAERVDCFCIARAAR